MQTEAHLVALGVFWQFLPCLNFGFPDNIPACPDNVSTVFLCCLSSFQPPM